MAAIVSALCLYVTWTDVKDRRIPNWALLTVFLVFVFSRLAFSPDWPWLAQLTTGLVYFVFFGCIAWFWPAALGMGDVKLIALLGFTLGFRALVFVLTAACLGALLVGLVLICTRRAGGGSTLPFAPFLTGGVLMLWFFG